MLKDLSDEEAADMALSFTDLECRVIALCSKGESWGYARLAEKTGATYAQVRAAGRRLQSKRLATVSPVRIGREFNGSAIFLNNRGEHVKHAVAALQRVRAKRN